MRSGNAALLLKIDDLMSMISVSNKVSDRAGKAGERTAKIIRQIRQRLDKLLIDGNGDMS